MTDVKLEKHLTGLLVNRQLLIVSNRQFETAKTIELVRRPSSLKLIDGMCYVADRSGDVYQVRKNLKFYFLTISKDRSNPRGGE